MLTSVTDPDLTLFEPSDLDGRPLPAAATRHRGAIETIAAWTHEYLCRPHPDLGRQGVVCPFVPPSLRRNTYWFALIEGAAELSDDALRARVLAYRDWFVRLEPTTEPASTFKTILVLFPDLSPELGVTLIDRIHARLKTEFLSQGLMLGEFHDPPPDKPGLRNSNWRPLSSPVPLLVIRVMVTMDFWFLRDDPRFVQAYLDRHGAELPEGMLAPVSAAAAEYGLEMPPPADQAAKRQIR